MEKLSKERNSIIAEVTPPVITRDIMNHQMIGSLLAENSAGALPHKAFTAVD